MYGACGLLVKLTLTCSYKADHQAEEQDHCGIGEVIPDVGWETTALYGEK